MADKTFCFFSYNGQTDFSPCLGGREGEENKNPISKIKNW